MLLYLNNKMFSCFVSEEKEKSHKKQRIEEEEDKNNLPAYIRAKDPWDYAEFEDYIKADKRKGLYIPVTPSAIITFNNNQKLETRLINLDKIREKYANAIRYKGGIDAVLLNKLIMYGDHKSWQMDFTYNKINYSYIFNSDGTSILQDANGLVVAIDEDNLSIRAFVWFCNALFEKQRIRENIS